MYVRDSNRARYFTRSIFYLIFQAVPSGAIEWSRLYIESTISTFRPVFPAITWSCCNCALAMTGISAWVCTAISICDSVTLFTEVSARIAFRYDANKSAVLSVTFWMLLTKKRGLALWWNRAITTGGLGFDSLGRSMTRPSRSLSL